MQIPYRLSNWRNTIANRAIDAARLFIESRLEEQIKQEEEQEEMGGESGEFRWCSLTRICIEDCLADNSDADPAFTTNGSFNFKTPEGIAAFVKFFTTEVNHTCPFHWKKWGWGVEKEVRVSQHLGVSTYSPIGSV